jgi:chemotaxis protein CheC
MILTDDQRDAVTEVLHIAFSRTANALSEITGHRVLLDLPQLRLCPIHELPVTLNGFVRGEIATVHQIFSKLG